MRRKFFLKNLLLFLIPLLIPTCVLGVLSINLTQRYIQGEIHTTQTQILQQLERNADMILNEMDSLAIVFGNSQTLFRVEEVLRTLTVSLDNLRLIESMVNYVNAPANARPFIESIYMYVPNPYGQFLASGEGLTSFDRFHDVGWKAEFEARAGAGDRWTSRRQITRYSFEGPISVTTFYKTLPSVLTDKPYAVIVMNVYNDYMDKTLRSIEQVPGQRLFILDENGTPLFQSGGGAEFGASLPTGLAAQDDSFDMELDGVAYNGAKLTMAGSGWTFVSLIPRHELVQVPFRLSQFTVYVVFLSFALGLVLTYFLTRRSLRHIRQMIAIIKAAGKGLPLPEVKPARGQDEYNYIIQTMTRNFIEQHYLTVQLSEKKYRLQAAELLALQSQINPHFLFNTLETLNWKVMGLTGGPNEANGMLGHLSEILKYSLDTPDRVVDVEEEITYTKHYIAIQKERYGDKFEVRWRYIPEEIRGCRIVKLLLQPLIENSLYHGIKEKEGNGAILVKMDRDADFLRIAVVDNGVGMSRGRLAEIRARLESAGDSEAGDSETGDRIGLANTNKRIRLSDPAGGELRFWSKAGFGTAVVIRIGVGVGR